MFMSIVCQLLTYHTDCDIVFCTYVKIVMYVRIHYIFVATYVLSEVIEYFKLKVLNCCV